MVYSAVENVTCSPKRDVNGFPENLTAALLVET